MTARSIRITLPMPMNKGNARMHWRATLKAKKDFFRECDLRQTLRMLPLPPAVPLEKCVVYARMYLWNPMDDDNAMARLKYALDWIRTRGYVRDDSRKVMKWAAFPRQIIDRSGPPHVELTLTEIALADSLAV